MPYNLAIPGWMPEPELQILERLAGTVPEGGAMLEVGPFAGRSSWCWSKSVAPGVSITCVDIWDPAEHPFHPPASVGIEPVKGDFGKLAEDAPPWGTQDMFAYQTRDCDNITAIRGRSPDDFLDWPENSLDLVFLDGVHHNPVFAQDVQHWYRRVKPGGILCGDDCARTHPDVLWTIDDFCKALAIPFTVERRIWMLQRPLENRKGARTEKTGSYALSA